MNISNPVNRRYNGRRVRVCSQCGQRERFFFSDTTVGDRCRKANMAHRESAIKRLPWYLEAGERFLERDAYEVPTRTSHKTRIHKATT